MKQLKLEFLQREFPNFEEAYFDCILTGISRLSKKVKSNGSAYYIDVLRGETDAKWHRYFNQREVYFRAIIKYWPSIILFEINRKIASADKLDNYLEIYRESHFGTFLSNTKALVMGFEELQPDWNSCYEGWINGNARILEPYADLIENNLDHAIRQIVNEVVVSPHKYHSSLATFRQLVKRQYQLSLSEQNC